MNILISAGPTREKIDPVRFISNRSSGKMGYAIAEAAVKKGHKVTLVSGPVNISAPRHVKMIKTESARDMVREIRKIAPKADLIIMAAAVSDYTPVKSSIKNRKIKKNSKNMTVTLKATEDILASLGRNKRANQILVGFAAETEDLLKNAAGKLEKKNLDWIIANDVSQKGIGFDSDYNEVVMISKDGLEIKIPKESKKNIAKKIIGIVCPKGRR